MITIEYLRKLAELNLCEDCFLKYKEIIEPNVQEYLSQPLSDFRQAESQITQMVMKAEGIFKDKRWILSFNKGEEEKVAKYIDVKGFRKIEKMGFKDKIDYLRKKGILQDCSYRLLDKAREARNKIHAEPILAAMSEKDYTLFSMASWITGQIWSAMRFDWEEEIVTNIKSNTERVAEQWLRTLQARPQEA
jgi:predicted GNAT family acetyltransferase